MLLCPKQRLSYRIVEKKENKQTNNRTKVQDRTKLKKEQENVQGGANRIPEGGGNGILQSNVIDFPLRGSSSSQERWLLYILAQVYPCPENPTATPPSLSTVPPTPNSPPVTPVHAALSLLGPKL